MAGLGKLLGETLATLPVAASADTKRALEKRFEAPQDSFELNTNNAHESKPIRPPIPPKPKSCIISDVEKQQIIVEMSQNGLSGRKKVRGCDSSKLNAQLDILSYQVTKRARYKILKASETLTLKETAFIQDYEQNQQDLLQMPVIPVIRKYMRRIIERRELSKKSPATKEDQKRLEKLNQGPAAIQQSLSASLLHVPSQERYYGLQATDKKFWTDEDILFVRGYEVQAAKKQQTNSRYLIGYDEKIQPGFRDTMGGDLYVDRDTIIVDPERDPILAANIAYCKQKLIDTPCSELKQWELIQEHVNSTFNLGQKTSLDILERLPLGSVNYFGTHIKHGVGICRHKALLAEIIAHELELKVARQAGFIVENGTQYKHMWNSVLINGEEYLFDANFLKNSLQPWSADLREKYVPFAY